MWIRFSRMVGRPGSQLIVVRPVEEELDLGHDNVVSVEDLAKLVIVGACRDHRRVVGLEHPDRLISRVRGSRDPALEAQGDGSPTPAPTNAPAIV